MYNWSFPTRGKSAVHVCITEARGQLLVVKAVSISHISSQNKELCYRAFSYVLDTVLRTS